MTHLYFYMTQWHTASKMCHNNGWRLLPDLSAVHDKGSGVLRYVYGNNTHHADTLYVEVGQGKAILGDHH